MYSSYFSLLPGFETRWGSCIRPWTWCILRRLTDIVVGIISENAPSPLSDSVNYDNYYGRGHRTGCIASPSYHLCSSFVFPHQLFTPHLSCLQPLCLKCVKHNSLVRLLNDLLARQCLRRLSRHGQAHMSLGFRCRDLIGPQMRCHFPTSCSKLCTLGQHKQQQRSQQQIQPLTHKSAVKAATDEGASHPVEVAKIATGGNKPDNISTTGGTMRNQINIGGGRFLSQTNSTSHHGTRYSGSIQGREAEQNDLHLLYELNNSETPTGLMPMCEQLADHSLRFQRNCHRNMVKFSGRLHKVMGVGNGLGGSGEFTSEESGVGLGNDASNLKLELQKTGFNTARDQRPGMLLSRAFNDILPECDQEGLKICQNEGRDTDAGGSMADRLHGFDKASSRVARCGSSVSPETPSERENYPQGKLTLEETSLVQGLHLAYRESPTHSNLQNAEKTKVNKRYTIKDK
ncbi:unnamed protein product [Protopolystoma xenopodis]|uniref:Uncharacterized protein n=1 Tax=Protopolystoma xenopodis TaxID=117903 RepID=A0A3S5CMF1_9PLAT|nr:unnamed protein product [Protopolystoma xenopodis]